MNLCLRPASCPYRLYPHDTLCTYGVKQLRLQVFSSWQGMRDSNPRKRSQSPVCYRYTNPLNGLLPKRMIIITISRKKSRLIFSFLQKLKPGGTGL